jgi:hypothetical protein
MSIGWERHSWMTLLPVSPHFLPRPFTFLPKAASFVANVPHLRFTYLTEPDGFSNSLQPGIYGPLFAWLNEPIPTPSLMPVAAASVFAPYPGQKLQAAVLAHAK